MKATILYEGKTYSSFNKIRLIEKSFGYDILLTLFNDAGTLINLTGKTVKLEIKDIAGPTLKSFDLSLSLTPTDGTATWTIEEDDLDIYSVFDTEVTVIDSTTSEQKFNLGLLTITQEL